MVEQRQKRNVIITGASRGLGRQIALTFAKTGDRVVVLYRAREDLALNVVSEIVQAGGTAVSFKADVRKADEVESAVTRTAEQWGEVDVLINNAGETRDRLLLRMSELDWDSVVRTNVTGPFHAIRSASRFMSLKRKGHIINIASIVALQGREGQANYAASKAALIGLTRAAARELGPLNIQVNAVLPGYLQTSMGKTVTGPMHDRIIQENVLNRASEPGEVAHFIYHLSCMRNVSGQVFNLDSRIV